MPLEGMWQQFFDPPAILKKLNLTSACGNLLEFGCGYGTFTIPAARMICGTVYALDIEEDMLACTKAKAMAANLQNVELRCRDFAVDGSGLADRSVDYVMLFNILHADERLELLREVERVLSVNGQLAVIHWNYDPTTPRGPSMSIRPRPSECVAWAAFAGLRSVSDGPVDLPPYHYGMLFQRR